MRRKATLKSMQLTLKKKRLNDTKQKLLILKHISKQNCVLLPFLNDESLHTLGEFIFNVVTKRVRLDNAQLKKVKRILKKDKTFYKKLIDVNTEDPLGYFRDSLKLDPQVGSGIVSLLATLAPLITSLILR